MDIKLSARLASYYITKSKFKVGNFSNLDCSTNLRSPKFFNRVTESIFLGAQIGNLYALNNDKILFGNSCHGLVKSLSKDRLISLFYEKNQIDLRKIEYL